jgi:hypothetical protein
MGRKSLSAVLAMRLSVGVLIGGQAWMTGTGAGPEILQPWLVLKRSGLGVKRPGHTR